MIEALDRIVMPGNDDLRITIEHFRKLTGMCEDFVIITDGVFNSGE